MSYVAETISDIVSEYINRTTFLPAIQREFVWEPAAVEKLFDSIMSDYPIGSFLFWKIREENKHDWTAYDFIKNFDEEQPHNSETRLDDVSQDIYLVLDGQQRMSAFYIGLKGSYRYFRYRWRKTKLYLNLFKQPYATDDPEELSNQFKFKEDDQSVKNDDLPQFWYPVGDMLNFTEAEDAKEAVRSQLSGYDDALKHNAFSLIGRLHNRVHTSKLINYFEVRIKSKEEYDRIVEIFIRANTGGKKLEYADILLSLASANMRNINA